MKNAKKRHKIKKSIPNTVYKHDSIYNYVPKQTSCAGEGDLIVLLINDKEMFSHKLIYPVEDLGPLVRQFIGQSIGCVYKSQGNIYKLIEIQKTDGVKYALSSSEYQKKSVEHSVQPLEERIPKSHIPHTPAGVYLSMSVLKFMLSFLPAKDQEQLEYELIPFVKGYQAKKEVAQQQRRSKRVSSLSKEKLSLIITQIPPGILRNAVYEQLLDWYHSMQNPAAAIEIKPVKWDPNSLTIFHKNSYR